MRVIWFALSASPGGARATLAEELRSLESGRLSGRELRSLEGLRPFGRELRSLVPRGEVTALVMRRRGLLGLPTQRQENRALIGQLGPEPLPPPFRVVGDRRSDLHVLVPLFSVSARSDYAQFDTHVLTRPNFLFLAMVNLPIASAAVLQSSRPLGVRVFSGICFGILHDLSRGLLGLGTAPLRFRLRLGFLGGHGCFNKRGKLIRALRFLLCGFLSDFRFALRFALGLRPLLLPQIVSALILAPLESTLPFLL